VGFGLNLVGAGLGALGGAFGASNRTSPTLVNPNFISNFKVGGVGNSTANGFTADRSAGFNNALGTAESSLNPLLSQILNHNSLGNQERFTNAFINSRRPQLETALQQQTQNLNKNIAGQGLAGSSSSIFAQGQNARNANEQRNQLFNQGILGGQALQQQDLQNLLGKFNLSQGLSQQNFGNTLQSALGLGGLLNQNNQSAINQADALNNIAIARNKFANQNNGNMLSSILSGAIGGAGLGNLFGGLGGGGSLSSMFGGLFGGGGGLLPGVTQPLDTQAAQARLNGIG